MPILIFEQDIMHVDSDDGIILNTGYVDAYFAERVAAGSTFTYVPEYDDSSVSIVQAIDDDCGESWKFIQSKVAPTAKG